MEKFELVSKFKPTGDQPKAIESLVQGLKENKKFQVLLGATGTGKTFTIGNVIEKINKLWFIIKHWQANFMLNLKNFFLIIV